MEIHEDVLQEFECLVCGRYVHPPINTCESGHSICETCSKRDTVCRFCRSSLCGPIRNISLEQLHDAFLMPCSFRAVGCDFKGQGQEVREHENGCDYAVPGCPLNLVSGCGWRGPLKNMVKHCIQEHPQNAYLTNQRHLMLENVPEILRRGETHYYPVLFFAYRKVFLCLCEINAKEKVTKWGMVYMGPKRESKRYSFMISYWNGRSSEEVTRMRSGCAPMNRRKMFPKGKLIQISTETLRANCRRNGNFYYTVTISQKGEDAEDSSQFSSIRRCHCRLSGNAALFSGWPALLAFLARTRRGQQFQALL